MGFVQGTNAGAGASSSGGTPNTYTLQFTTQNCAVGNLLIMCVRTNGGGVITGVSDDESNSWHLVGPITDAVNLYFAYALNIAGGTKASVTLTFSGTSAVGGLSMCIGEYSGVNAFRASDAGNTGVGDNAISAAVTATAGDLLIGYMANLDGQSTFTAGLVGGSAGALRETSIFGSAVYAAFEDNTNASGGSSTAAFASASSTTWTAGVSAFFKQPPVATGGVITADMSTRYRARIFTARAAREVSGPRTTEVRTKPS